MVWCPRWSAGQSYLYCLLAKREDGDTAARPVSPLCQGMHRHRYHPDDPRSSSEGYEGSLTQHEEVRKRSSDSPAIPCSLCHLCYIHTQHSVSLSPSFCLLPRGFNLYKRGLSSCERAYTLHRKGRATANRGGIVSNFDPLAAFG